MKKYLKLEYGIYDPSDPGTGHNKVVDSAVTTDVMYEPWVEIDDVMYDRYLRMRDNPQGLIKTIPGAFIEYTSSGPMQGLNIAVPPPPGGHPPELLPGGSEFTINND